MSGNALYSYYIITIGSLFFAVHDKGCSLPGSHFVLRFMKFLESIRKVSIRFRSF